MKAEKLRFGYGLLIKLCLAVYIFTALLNFNTLDFCGDHIEPLSVVFSSVTYFLIAFITELEIFKIKNIDHLSCCLLFWGIHFCLILSLFVFPSDLTMVLVLLFAAPSIGILVPSVETVYLWIVPCFCLVQVILVLRSIRKHHCRY